MSGPDHGSTVTPIKGAAWKDLQHTREAMGEGGDEYPPPPGALRPNPHNFASAPVATSSFAVSTASTAFPITRPPRHAHVHISHFFSHPLIVFILLFLPLRRDEGDARGDEGGQNTAAVP